MIFGKIKTNSSIPQSALSLVEMLIIVAVIGIVAAITIPAIGKLRNAAKRMAAIQNAKNISQMSQALAALGVAHVIPDSMGGVAATARLLREGVIVPEGPMAGEKFVMAGLLDDDIDEISAYLYVQYDQRELRVVFRELDVDPSSAIYRPGQGMLCLLRGKVQKTTLLWMGWITPVR